MKVLVTGGAGFVGSALVRHLVLARCDDVCTVDKLTYAGSLDNLASVEGRANHRFERIDIRDRTRMREVIANFAPDALMNLAAESHVDRSIDGPDDFIQTNITGTYALLESVREYRQSRGRECRFIHISTDEVYGSLGHSGTFTENSPHRPNSPYAASKAASDQLVRAWWKTFGLPVITTHSSNNYGPRQFAEKLIPLATLRALEGLPVPVYGDGRQVRDWLHVDDHVRALGAVLDRGHPGRTYNIGAGCEKTNLEVVGTVLKAVAERSGLDEKIVRRRIEFVPDRPGHDRRYALDTSRIVRELDWTPLVDFDAGISATVDWYAENVEWRKAATAVYAGERLGLQPAQEIERFDRRPSC